MRIIDKDALLSDIERTIEESGCVNHEGEIMDCVRYAPEVDAAPVARGEWIHTGITNVYGGHQHKCSVCGYSLMVSPACDNENYCGMEHCFEALSRCDELWLTGNWRESRGCNMEYGFAKAKGIPVKFIG